jgi:uncharacterized iron-regulated membrane protein
MSQSVPVSRALHFAKRWLYVVHRWIGIGTCVLFAIWFFSGVVMMYVPFPSLSAGERLAGLDAIRWEQVHFGPDIALRGSGEKQFPGALDLEMENGEAVWRIGPVDGLRSAWSARNGQRSGTIGPRQAAQIAERFVGTDAILHTEEMTRDQWTVAGRFDRDRPLFRVDVNDAVGTSLYVSSRSGEVVLDTTRSERFWNWLGSVPHWIYFTQLRAVQPLWRQVVMWVSGVGIVSAVTGMWVGILRMRLRHRYSGGRNTPYRGWQKWHHVTGLIGGLFLTTWIISGWLSVDPFRWFTTPGISVMAKADYARASLVRPIDFAKISSELLVGARRVRINWVNGQMLLLVERPNRSVEVLDAQTGLPAHLNDAQLASAATRLVPNHRATVTLLAHENSYYYESNGLPELPVLRVVFDDPLQTNTYISPKTGEILAEDDSTRRWYRWVYQGMHTWDIEVLTGHRPLWDVLIWLASAAGLLISTSGVVIGWRRLVRPKRRSFKTLL